MNIFGLYLGGELCCLLLQDLYESCARGGSEKRGRVLWDATSRGLCGRVGPPRTNVRAAYYSAHEILTIDVPNTEFLTIVAANLKF